MRFLCLTLACAIALGFAGAGEEYSPMRGGPSRPDNGVYGVRRVDSLSQPGEVVVPPAPSPREFVRVKLPPVTADQPGGRPRMVEVPAGDHNSPIIFRPGPAAASSQGVGIPGLVTPEALAIDKYALSEFGPRLPTYVQTLRQENRAPAVSGPAAPATMASAFPLSGDEFPDIALPEYLFPAIDLYAPATAAAPAVPQSPPPAAMTTVILPPLPPGTPAPVVEPSPLPIPVFAPVPSLLAAEPFSWPPAVAPQAWPAEPTPVPNVAAGPMWDGPPLPRGEVWGLEPPKKKTPPAEEPIPAGTPDDLPRSVPALPPVDEPLPAVAIAAPLTLTPPTFPVEQGIDDAQAAPLPIPALPEANQGAYADHVEVPYPDLPLPPGMYP